MTEPTTEPMADVALTRRRADEHTAVVLTRELTIGLAVFALYLAVDLLPKDEARADATGRWLLGVERALHLDVEHRANDWLAGHPNLTVLFNYEYAVTYVVSAFGLLAWVLITRPELFRRVRTSFVVLNLVGIVWFALTPTTPPRLLPGADYTDTVATRHTWGSWGTPLIDASNQLAALPSLHLAWALWVSAVLAALALGRTVQVASAAHVVLTFVVVIATANHYVLDAAAAVVVVVAAERIAARVDSPRGAPLRLAPADAFFLHVEDAGAPQVVGGVVVLDGCPTVADLRRLVRGELDRLPRFRQRLAPTGRWRRPRWEGAGPLDWDWHVIERPVDGRAGLHRLVAELAEEPLPRDRPLWRLVLVPGVAPGHCGVVLLMHHAVADGIGTVVQALNLLRPRVMIPRSPEGPRPGRLARAAATVGGLALLATDGHAHGRLGAGGPRRDFATGALDLDGVRRTAAAHGVRVTDVLLSLTAGGLARARPGLALDRVRVAVPVMVQSPGDAAEGNATAALLVDVPLRPDPELRREPRLDGSARALAGRFVMATGLRVLPEPAAAWFARAVYGRRFFHGVLSNMPGPGVAMTMAGAPLDEVYPLLPLAPGTPFAVGALSWNGVLGLGVVTDPDVVGADELVAAILATAAQ